MDITSEDHYVSVGVCGLQRLELNVQVGEDLDGGHVRQSNGWCKPLGPREFDGEPRIESRVFCFFQPEHAAATRIRYDTGFMTGIAKSVVDRVVAVPMYPESAALDEVCWQPGSIGAAGAVLLVPACNRSLVWQVMGDHNCFSRVPFGQGSLQPGPALAVQPLDVIGIDQALRRETELVALSQVLLVVVNPDGVVIGQVAA